MPESFLTVLKQSGADGNMGGDEQGGATGSRGNALPSGRPNEFMFATGVECSYPTIDNGRIRRDMLEECGHYKHYKQDIALVQEIGLRYLRYGLPYHKVHLGPGRFDWEFSDLVMKEIQDRGIIPVLDLLHFGLPDWLGSFQNPELPMHFADYAEAVAQRYPWVRFYTPVNEIYVCARFSALEGTWNEQLKTPQAFVTAIKHLCAASILANQRIARHRPDCVIVQSESAETTTEMRAAPSPQSLLTEEVRFLALDLLYAYRPNADVLLYMLDNGMTRQEFDWFMAGKPPGYQVMGNDYYGRNEKMILPDGTQIQAEDLYGWYGITKTYFKRYLRPLMHTETNVFDPDLAPTWLWKQWGNILRMRADDVAVLGFTWYSLTDQIDWDKGLAEKVGTVNACGLYDLERRPRPVAEAYKMLLKEYGQISLIPRGEMFAITGEPARLATEV